jgi:hypothetical protein
MIRAKHSGLIRGVFVVVMMPLPEEWAACTSAFSLGKFVRALLTISGEIALNFGSNSRVLIGVNF